MMSLFDDLVVTCDEIEHILESAPINHSYGINNWLIAVVLLAMVFLLLLVVILVTYYIKRQLTIPCLLSH